MYNKYILLGKSIKTESWYPLLLDDSFTDIEVLVANNLCTYFDTLNQANRIRDKIKNNKKFSKIIIGLIVMHSELRSDAQKTKGFRGEKKE